MLDVAKIKDKMNEKARRNAITKIEHETGAYLKTLHKIQTKSTNTHKMTIMDLWNIT
jgi:hypothetical protein